MKIIGIGGTFGSGKDTAGQIMAEHNWLFVSVTEILRDEARKRSWPIERSSLWTISAEWRRDSGLGVLVDKAVGIFKKSSERYKGLAIASLRNPGEADRVHKLGGQVIWVDADPRIRYQRIISRQRSDEDRKTFEEFLAEEKIETNQIGDEAVLSLAGVKQRADIFIENNSNDIEDFKKTVKEALNLN